MTITFRAKSPEDLLAVVPVTLGFEPEESIVMLTFGGSAPPHARIDLTPRGAPEAADVVAASLLEPCRRHRVERVVFVLYGSHAGHCRQLARVLRRRFERHGIVVLECLRADAGRWFSADGRRRGVPEQGVPYDIDAHPFRAEAVMAGHVTLASRADLAASIAADDEGCAAVEALLDGAVLLTAEELGELCRRHAAAGTAPPDLEAARMLLTVQVGQLRDVAWVPLTRQTAAAHVRLWRDLVRRAPGPLLPAAAAVLAFASWLEGAGALAWCALDRCFQVEPEQSLGRLVAHMLEGALPPTAWESMRESLDDLLGWVG